jgi:hypothetical protein
MLRDPSVPATTSHAISHSVHEPEQRRVPLHATDLCVSHPEADIAAVPVPRVGEIDEDVGLRVQPAARIDQRGEVDPVPGSVETQLDTVMLVPVGVHPIADTGLHDGLHDTVLEDAGPVRRLDLVPGPGVDRHVVYSALGEQVGKHQAGRARTHDADSSLDRLGHPRAFLILGNSIVRSCT